jgi:GntR family transcriptional regulator
MSVVDRGTATPLYYQLREELKRRILGREWKAGELLPGELALCAEHSVSRSVVRQAIGDLVYDGLVERRQGVGTFVAQPKIREGLAAREVGFYEDMTSKGYQVTTEVIRQVLQKASPEAAAQLEIAAGDTVLFVSRVRCVDGVPLVYVESRLPEARVRGLVGEDLENQSLYAILRSRYGIRVSTSRRLIGACAATRRVARLLEIEPGSPLVVLESVSYAEAEAVPLETYLAYHRADRTKFEVETHADGLTLNDLHLTGRECD